MTTDRELKAEINRQIALRISLRDSYVGDGEQKKADVIQGEIVGLVVARDLIATRPLRPEGGVREAIKERLFVESFWIAEEGKYRGSNEIIPTGQYVALGVACEIIASLLPPQEGKGEEIA